LIALCFAVFSDNIPPCGGILTSGSHFLTPPFEAKETLFYKSVKRVSALFAFLPAAMFCWQKQKGFPLHILLL